MGKNGTNKTKSRVYLPTHGKQHPFTPACPKLFCDKTPTQITSFQQRNRTAQIQSRNIAHTQEKLINY